VGVRQQPATTQRKGRYLAAATAHPAKMLPTLAATAITSYTRPGRIRRASGRGILSMSRWAYGVNRVTYPMGSGVVGTEQGGHLFERDGPFRAFGFRFVGRLVEPGSLGLFCEVTQALVLVDINQPRLPACRAE
jgi:hypothetical protein